MKILYLTTVLPSKKTTGGEIASQSFIDALQHDGHEVLVLGYQRPGSISKAKTNEIPIAERHIETEKSRFYPMLWMSLGLLKNLPYSSAKYYSQKYINQLKIILKQEKFDIFIIDHAQMGWLAPFVNNKAKIIFIAHNVEHEIYLAQLKNSQSQISQHIYQRETDLIKDMEDNLAKTATQVWTFTEDDASYFLNINKASKSFHLPSSLKISPHQPTIKNFDIGIIGSWTWKANKLGLNWFLEKVYPHLPTNLSIHIAGLGAEWLRGKYPNINYCGFVPSVQTFMTQAKVLAIPSISGGGVQIKTLDAIASGSPLVATPTALRGISEYPSSVIVAEKPEEFANSLVQLLTLNTIPDICADAIAWSENRHSKFLTDIIYAINHL
ncbi:MAG: glycosyltransferase [Tolypothrix brevis GSE-NOS-MK-07-07A]|jgi:glycosyltransferase involved in cell wall biosynthesis|nr:glycosyltransferase [Tolypothrix brevis GSE-NOS-MK-07-07A]